MEQASSAFGFFSFLVTVGILIMNLPTHLFVAASFVVHADPFFVVYRVGHFQVVLHHHARSRKVD